MGEPVIDREQQIARVVGRAERVESPQRRLGEIRLAVRSEYAGECLRSRRENAHRGDDERPCVVTICNGRQRSQPMPRCGEFRNGSGLGKPRDERRLAACAFGRARSGARCREAVARLDRPGKRAIPGQQPIR